MTEPYDLEGDEVAALTAKCKPYGLDVHISGEHAVHFLRHALAVIVMRAVIGVIITRTVELGAATAIYLRSKVPDASCLWKVDAI